MKYNSDKKNLKKKFSYVTPDTFKKTGLSDIFGKFKTGKSAQESKDQIREELWGIPRKKRENEIQKRR